MIRFAALALLLALVVPAPAAAQHPQRSASITEGVDFQVYGPKGEVRSFAELLAALDDTEAALVGEYHDDVVGHQVESEILVRAAQRFGIMGDEAVTERPLVLSLEFFERDVQLPLDEYLAGDITEDQFLKVGRPWENYQTAYRPMVQFAKGHGVPVLAANAPRRYVNRVTRLGPDSLSTLSEEAKAFLPPLPYPGPSEEYRAQFFEAMMEGMAAAEEEGGDEAEVEAEEVEEAPTDRTGQAAPVNHGMGYALQSQALWDASMSHAIAEALDRDPRALVIHYVGGFHVAEHTGIPEKVLHYRPQTRVLTISMVPAEDVGAWDDDEYEGMADFVILTKELPEGHGG